MTQFWFLSYENELVRKNICKAPNKTLHLEYVFLKKSSRFNSEKRNNPIIK